MERLKFVHTVVCKLYLCSPSTPSSPIHPSLQNKHSITCKNKKKIKQTNKTIRNKTRTDAHTYTYTHIYMHMHTPFYLTQFFQFSLGHGTAQGGYKDNKDSCRLYLYGVDWVGDTSSPLRKSGVRCDAGVASQWSQGRTCWKICILPEFWSQVPKNKIERLFYFVLFF